MAKTVKIQTEITSKDKTKTAFTSVQGRLHRLKNSLVSVKGAMALVVGAGFVSMTKEALKSADAIGKFADRAGVTTTQLQKMRYAFNLAGVSAEAVDKSMITFGKRLGKARGETGALHGGLIKLDSGLLETLKASESTGQAMNILFKAMGSTTDQALKLALADAGFGGAGLLMTAAFKDGSNAFFEAQKTAEALGLVLREELIRDAEQLGDELSNTSQIITMQMVPAFLYLAKHISGALEELNHLFLVMNKNKFSASNPISGMEQAFRSLAIVIDDVGIAMAKLMGNKSLENTFKQNRMASLKLLHDGREAAKQGDGSMTLTNPRKARPGKGRSGTSSSKPSGIMTLMDGFDSEKLLDREFDKGLAVNAAFKAREKSLSIFVKEIEFQKDLTKKRMEEGEQVARIMEIENELGVSLDIRYTNEKKQIIEIMEQHERLNQQLELQNQIVGIGERVFDRAADGIITAMQKGENAMESFKNVAMAALFDVGQEMLRMAVFEPVKKAGSSFLADMAGSIAGSFFGGGGSSGSPANTPMGPTPFAKGGFISAGTTALVGERGAEIFRPTGGGTIIPNDQLGGGAVNVTLNLSTGVQSTVRAEVMGLMPMITSQVKNAVAEARQRGGSFSDAMGA